MGCADQVRARLTALVLALSALAAGAAPAHAYLIQTFDVPTGRVHQAWRNPEKIPFTLHASGSSHLTPSGTLQALRDCFAVWDAAPTARVGFVDKGTTITRTPVRGDGVNLLCFDSTGRYLQAPPNSGIIALTQVNSDDATGEIVDADIVFNDREFVFVVDDSSSASAIDLRDTAVHEIGHLLGLEHTPLDGTAQTRPTMNPFNRGDWHGQGATLETDDIAGISALHPATSFAQQTGSITGQVIRLDGTPLFGVFLVAENVDTGAQVCTLSGSELGAATVGSYALRGLPPGRYRVHALPMASDITEDNFSGIFTGLASGYPEEYYDNVTDVALAHLLDVQAGQTLDGIDVVSGLAQPGYPVLRYLQRLANTPDQSGPYTVELEADDAQQAWLRYRLSDGGLEYRVAMQGAAAGAFSGQIPGQSVSTALFYQVEVQSPEGNTSIFPAAQQWLSFSVVATSGAPLAYAALRDQDVVGVLDTGTGKELARVPVGDEPIQVLLQPKTQRLFVSSLSANEVAVVSTRTFQVERRLPTGSMPLDMALSPDGSALYVAISGAGTLMRVDLSDFSARDLAVPVSDDGPYGVAAVGQEEYVADLEGGRIFAMDPSGTVLAQISVPQQPRCLAASPDGQKVYASSMATQYLTVIDVASRTLLQRVPLGVSGTFAVATSLDGHKVYATAYDDAALVVVDAATATVLTTVPLGADPRALSLSPDGKQVYVTCAAGNQLAVVDAAADTLIQVQSLGPNPRGIAVGLAPAQEHPTDVALSPAQPQALALAPAFPNPFNASTQIGYTLSGPGLQSVRLTIVNLLGQRIRVLADAAQAAGAHRMTWDGRSDAGNTAGSGVYWAVLEAGGQRLTRKLLLLR